MRAINDLVWRLHSQRFSDNTFERLETKSGTLDINSALRRKVDGMGGPPTERVSDRPDCPLTTWFAPGAGGGSDRAPYNGAARERAHQPILPGRTVHKNRLNVNATSAEILIREMLNECRNLLYASPRRRLKLWGLKDSCTSQRLWGGNPTIHIERYRDRRLAHESERF
jgi:hypothetical protein